MRFNQHQVYRAALIAARFDPTLAGFGNACSSMAFTNPYWQELAARWSDHEDFSLPEEELWAKYISARKG